MAECVLRVSDLTKRFGSLVAVDRLNLEVRRGEILGFLGPNGAGKTTSLKMICGQLRPDTGKIELNGLPIVPGSHGLSSLGVAPQNLVIWEMLTCFEQLELAGRLYGQRRVQARARAEQLLDAFGLKDKANCLGKTLSGGMQRRLNIALGLVHEPEILLLDEPQAGLDPQSRVLVRDYLQSLRGKMTVVITTHDMEEAEKLADRVCIVDQGKVLLLDTVDGLKRRFSDGALTEIVIDRVVTEPILRQLESLSLSCAVSGEDCKLRLASSRSTDDLVEVLKALGPSGLQVVGVHTREATLEDVFIQLTGRNLRE